MKTIALDFETACPAPGNACQIGLAWIEGGRVTRVESRLIRPRDMHFTFTWCHGITADHVWDKPEFPEVLEEFRADLEGALVFAHNAGFDAAVMRDCTCIYEIPHPEMTYACTLQIARAVWPELKSKKLSSLADHLGIRFQHHNAGEDALVCAWIALAAARVMGVFDVAELPDRLAAWRERARDVA
jgi:DNA polymerase-3 subunit epsilon